MARLVNVSCSINTFLWLRFDHVMIMDQDQGPVMIGLKIPFAKYPDLRLKQL